MESEPVINKETSSDEHPAAEELSVSDALSNPLLRAFILDLEDVEMTPMLHLVANMMTSMYFDEAETAVVRHYLLHKVDSTINRIQQRMDELNSDVTNGQMLDYAVQQVDVNLDEADDENQTTTGG